MSCASGGIGIMFLNEVVLGKEYQVGVGDCNYVAAPKGYDSIVARGYTEPGTGNYIILIALSLQVLLEVMC